MSDDKTVLYFLAFIAVLTVLFLWTFGGVSQEQINACVETSNWSEARCKIELSK